MFQRSHLEILRDKNAGLLVAGQFLSQVCDKMMTVGLVWLFTQSYSLKIIPWFLGISALPHLLLSFTTGKWIARWSPLKTVIAADWLRALLFVLLFFLWHHLPANAELPALFTASFLANCASAFFNPAIMSLPLSIAEAKNLQQLTAMIDSCFSLGNILGPLCSVLLFPLVGLSGLFLLNGLSYALAGILEAKIQVKLAPASEETEVHTGKTMLPKDSLIVFMLLGFLSMNLFLAPIMVFLPLFVKVAYQGSIRSLASLESAIGAGTLLGSVLLSLVPIVTKTGKKICAGMIAISLAYLTFALTNSVWQGIVALFVLGCAMSCANIFILNLFQTRPAAQNVPAVMSFVNLISVATLPLSMAAVGFMIEHVDVRSLALGFSVILLLITAFIVSNRELRSQ